MRFVFISFLFFVIGDVVSGDRLRCFLSPNYTWNHNYKHENIILTVCEIKDQKVEIAGVTIESEPESLVDGLVIQNQTNFEFLPEKISHTFPKLRVIEIIGCSLKLISGNHFKGLEELEYLDLRGNGIESIESGAFKDQKNLYQLHLGVNNIQVLRPEIFKGLEGLKEVWLRENGIEFLLKETFELLTSVERISLGRNKLTFIPENLFENNVNLIEIWLHGNRINSISPNMFDDLTKLEYLDFQGNSCWSSYYNSDELTKMKNDIKAHCSYPQVKENILKSFLY